jgi:transcription termination/antitermination protein NusG
MSDEEGVGILPTPQETPQSVPAETAAKEAAPKAPQPTAPADDTPEPETKIVVLKTQVGQERRVAETLTNKARKFGLPVLSILSPQELRGYVFIETTDILAIEKGIRGVSYARSLVAHNEEVRDDDGNFIRDRRGKIVTERKPVETPFSEIEHFLTPVSAVAKIAEGDIVELVSGPFRGEKAKVTRVDDAREEITVELIDSMVPIPITVKGENVRVLEKGA